jgi:hypothetical protein
MFPEASAGWASIPYVLISMQVLVLNVDNKRGIMLSTKRLEPKPGDMLRDPKLVFERGEEMAEIYRKQLETGRKRIKRKKCQSG